MRVIWKNENNPAKRRSIFAGRGATGDENEAFGDTERLEKSALLRRAADVIGAPQKDEVFLGEEERQGAKKRREETKRREEKLLPRRGGACGQLRASYMEERK